MTALWCNLRGVLCVLALMLAAPAGSAIAQSIGVVQNNIIVLDTELLFEESEFGQQMIADYNEAREALIARNREIEAELTAEEQALTDKRDEVSAEEFRELADAFDEKVQGFRERTERKARDLERNRERAPVEFMRRIEPVLVELMNDAGADIIITKRQVLLASDVIDVTDLAIARVDAALEEGRLPRPGGDPDDPGATDGGAE